MQLICRQPCPLQKRSRLICIDVETVASLLPQVDRRRCRTVFACRELPCVAVREDPVTRLYQRQAELAYPAADLNILFLDPDCFFEKCLFCLFNGRAFFLHFQKNALHPAQCPGKIHCCRPRGIQIVFLFLELRYEEFIVLRLCLFAQQIDPKGSTDPDRRGPSNLQQINSIPDLFRCSEQDQFLPARQQRLINDPDRILIIQQLNSFILKN